MFLSSREHWLLRFSLLLCPPLALRGGDSLAGFGTEVTLLSCGTTAFGAGGIAGQEPSYFFEYRNL